MHVALVYNAPAEDSAVDEEDVLVQRDAVAAALSNLGHEVSLVAASIEPSSLALWKGVWADIDENSASNQGNRLNALAPALSQKEREFARESLQDLASELRRLQPQAIFNLVESLGGSDRGMLWATSLYDDLAIPYSGSSTEAIYLSTGKVIAKQRMVAAGLPTAAWLVSQTVSTERESSNRFTNYPAKAVIKTIWEHASFGLDDAAIVTAADEGELRQLLAAREELLRRPCFAEAFIEGREFNLSILDGPSGAEVLPPAEIDFSAFPIGKPRIVGYDAKWATETFEYQQTPRRFDSLANDSDLKASLSSLALQCWRAFGMRGYARVDFRVDVDGRPCILEVNANPCLSPDAGFAAALGQAGISYEVALARILGRARAKAEVGQVEKC